MANDFIRAITPFAVALLVASVAVAQDGRVPDAEAAFAAAKAAGRDVAVFYHGSDWCRAGERVKQEIWDPPAFARQLADRFVLVAVDEPEFVESKAAAAIKARLPKGESMAGEQMLAVSSKAGVAFTKQPDSSWLCDTKNNPAQDVLSIQFKTGQGGAGCIMVEALPDDAFPNRGPGRASNGNFALTEAELLDAGKVKVQFSAAWASRQEGAQGADNVIDGVLKPDNCWNSASHANHNSATLVLVSARPLAANAEYTLQLHFAAQWGQHIAGRVRVCAPPPDETLQRSVTALSELKGLQRRNARVLRKSQNFPAVLLFGTNELNYARLDGIWDRDAATLVRDLRKFSDDRIARDAKWAAAAKAAGVERARLEGEGLDLTAQWDGSFKSHVEEIKKGDPNDETGYVRKYTFNLGEHHNAVNKLVGDKKFAEALAYTDQQIAHPKNARLSDQQRQELVMMKYDLYRRWSGHEEQRFGVLPDVIKINPTNHLAAGAEGYLRAYGRSGLALHQNGWFPKDCQKGEQTWEIERGVNIAFDHAGQYRLTAFHVSGKSTLTIKSVELLADGEVVAACVETKPVGPTAKEAAFLLSLPEFKPDMKFAMRVNYSATETDSRGGFRVKPLLD